MLLYPVDMAMLFSIDIRTIPTKYPHDTRMIPRRSSWSWNGQEACVCDRVRSFLIWMSASLARNFSCLGFRLHPRCEARVGISASSFYAPGAPPPDEGVELCVVEFCIVVSSCVK
jgi:hypothetical protein